MKKFKLKTPCLIDGLKSHVEIKKQLITLLNETESDFLEDNTEYFGDLIHRLDWSKSCDFSRKWVKFLKPYLYKQLKKFEEII